MTRRFFVVSSCYFFAFYKPAYCSRVIFLVPRVSPLPKGFSVSKMVSVSAPSGGGGGGGGEGVLYQNFVISEPLRVRNLTQFRTKNPSIHALLRITLSIQLHRLGQRTESMPSCFKAIYWQLQLLLYTCSANKFH